MNAYTQLQLHQISPLSTPAWRQQIYTNIPISLVTDHRQNMGVNETLQILCEYETQCAGPASFPPLACTALSAMQLSGPQQSAVCRVELRVAAESKRLVP